QDNRKRNLAILGRSVAESATQYFYVHQEHYCAGNKTAAEQFGRIALSFPNLDDSFRYEVQLNLARLVASRREAMGFAMGAHGVFPWCREAGAYRAGPAVDARGQMVWLGRARPRGASLPSRRPNGRRGGDAARFPQAHRTANPPHAKDSRQLNQVRFVPRRVALDGDAAEPGTICVVAEDGMVPPHNWDERVLASGCTLIDAENIEKILGTKKP
ncbi:hypothetical protein JZU54_05700, partial [bacterium]|nr:hypothetical protein [bacterium]